MHPYAVIYLLTKKDSKLYLNGCCLVNNPYQDTKIKSDHVKCIVTRARNKPMIWDLHEP